MHLTNNEATSLSVHLMCTNHLWGTSHSLVLYLVSVICPHIVEPFILWKQNLRLWRNSICTFQLLWQKLVLLICVWRCVTTGERETVCASLYSLLQHLPTQISSWSSHSCRCAIQVRATCSFIRSMPVMQKMSDICGDAFLLTSSILGSCSARNLKVVHNDYSVYTSTL